MTRFSQRFVGRMPRSRVLRVLKIFSTLQIGLKVGKVVGTYNIQKHFDIAHHTDLLRDAGWTIGSRSSSCGKS